MKRLLLLLLAGIATFAASSQNHQGPLTTQIAQFEQELERLKEVLKIPGMSVAVLKGQQIIWSRGFGYSDIESKVAATDSTPYLIASLTKPIAATLFLQCLEQEKAGLDEPLSKYHQHFQSDRVHIRHILTHTAAVFNEGMKPGDQYSYNGAFFGYLATVIGKAAGKPFRDQLVTRLLESLGMYQSVPGQNILETTDLPAAIYTDTVKSRYRTILDHLAKPYTLYGAHENILSPYPPGFIGSSAGLISTVTDLAKFDIAIDEHILIQPETQQLAWTNSKNNAGSKIPYGLGWFVQKESGTKLVWHYGQWPTFTGLYLKIPKKNLTLLLLCNSAGLNAPFDMAKGDVLASPFALAFFRNFVLKKQGDENILERERMADLAIRRYLENRVARVRKEINLDPSLPAYYTGTYKIDSMNSVKISRNSDRLSIEYPGQPLVSLFPETEEKFFVKTADVQVEFNRNAAWKVDGLTLVVDGKRRYAKKAGM